VHRCDRNDQTQHPSVIDREPLFFPWGYLASSEKLGVAVSKGTVANVLRRHGDQVHLVVRRRTRLDRHRGHQDAGPFPKGERVSSRASASGSDLE